MIDFADPFWLIPFARSLAPWTPVPYHCWLLWASRHASRALVS